MISLLVASCFAPAPLPGLAPGAAPYVVRWPGGSVVLDPLTGRPTVTMNGREVVTRQPAHDGRSTTVISGSGNGFGNRIVVSNGGAGGTTIIQNARNGWGNRIVVDPDEEVIELPPAGVAVERRPAAPATRPGKDGTFWTQKVWSDAYDCNLYWSPTDRSWYRYQRDDDSYRPVSGRP